MDYFTLNYLQLFGIMSTGIGIGIMLCMFQCNRRKRNYSVVSEDTKKKENQKQESSPTKRLRSMSSMEKLNVFFDIEENKESNSNTININIHKTKSHIKSKSTHNILNEKEYEIENIRINFEKYKLHCGICKTLIPSYQEVYCYMDNRFCSIDCREHYYKINGENFKRRSSF